MILKKCFLIILIVWRVHVTLCQDNQKETEIVTFHNVIKINDQSSTLIDETLEQKSLAPARITSQADSLTPTDNLDHETVSLLVDLKPSISRIDGSEDDTTTTTIDYTQTDDATESTSTTDDIETSTEPSTTTEDTTTTDEDTNCSITNVKHLLSETNELKITWSLTSLQLVICRGIILDFEVTLKECNSNCVTKHTSELTDRNITLPNKLEACATYEYKIKRDNLLEFHTDVRTNEEFEKILVTSEEQIDSVTLRVSWDEPKLFPYCEKKFRIEVRENNKEILKSETSNLYENITNLYPCEDYVVSIYPLSQGEPVLEYGETIYHTMSPVLPTGIRGMDVTYEESDYSIKIDWQSPELGAKCVKSYEVKIESDVDNRTRIVNMTYEGFTNVYACIDYYVKINSLTINNMSSAEVMKDIRIPSRVFSAPSTPRVINSTSTTVFLSTTVNHDTQRNYCEIKRTEFECMTNEGAIVRKAEKSTSFELTGLKPFTNYHCFASVENQESFGQVPQFSVRSEERTFVTKEGKPDKPTVHILNDKTTDSTFYVNWDSPKNPNGEIRSYNVYIKLRNFCYYNPSHCDSEFPREFEETVLVESNNSFVFEEAFPYASYYIQVQAVNGAEISDYSSPETCETLPAPPNQVRNFTMINREQVLSEPYNRTVVLQWRLPCRANGDIVKFEIECVQRGTDEVLLFEVFVTDNREEYFLVTEDFPPDTHHRVSIRAVTEHHKGEEFSKMIEIEAGVPDLSTWQPNEILIEPSTKMAKLTIPTSIFDSNVGSVLRIFVLLAELDCGNKITRQIGFLHDQPTYKWWKEVAEEECIPQYQTGSIEGDVRSISQRTEEDGSINFSIGTESCESTRLCNGPLEPDTTYALTLRVFTSKGFADTEYVKIKTEKETPLFLISVSILSVMCIVFVIGFYVTYRRTKALRKQSNDNSPNCSKDVSVSEFAHFHRDLFENNRERIKEEYNALQSFSDSLDKTCIASIANEKLNRYSNISPFDYNRVVLNDDDDFDENDYINASYINGYHYPREYIASQGPKPNTGHDFWRMILQHRVESIVMLTSLIECDKVKCHEYFPKLNGQITFANINIRCKREEVYPTFIKRILEVEKSDVKHSVRHYYYRSWPDHGVPSNASEIIEFCRIIRSERQKLDGTIVIHCSAGVGRTGTFIALDIMMQRMKQEKKINIFDLVKQLRSQRMKMVQCMDQYEFLYTSGLEMIEARRKQPQVFQNLALYLNELKVFNRLKKGSKTLRTSESSF